MTADERAIIERVKESLVAVGVPVSLNDTIRHLIRAAEIPRPADLDQAAAAWAGHRQECAECDGGTRPRCADGVLIRREHQRHLGLRDGRSYVLQPVTEPLHS